MTQLTHDIAHYFGYNTFLVGKLMGLFSVAEVRVVSLPRVIPQRHSFYILPHLRPSLSSKPTRPPDPSLSEPIPFEPVVVISLRHSSTEASTWNPSVNGQKSDSKSLNPKFPSEPHQNTLQVTTCSKLLPPSSQSSLWLLSQTSESSIWLQLQVVKRHTSLHFFKTPESYSLMIRTKLGRRV